MQAPPVKLLAAAILAVVIVTNSVALWHETAITRIDLNDNVLHLGLIQRIAQAVQSGENPLDCWSPEWSSGFPVVRVYQPLAHLLVLALYFLLGKTFSLVTIFIWCRYFSIALLPLSFFWAAKRLGLSPMTAAAAALLSPLISTDFLYGIEYGSYVWAGSGLYPQAVATHLLLASIGFSYTAVREGRRWIPAGVSIGLTLICHLIYGYVAALTLLLLAVTPDAGILRLLRLGRTAAISFIALTVSAFQLVPILLDAPLINHSRWESAWKWDSFGAATVLARLFTGELLDHGRLPILTVLAFSGVALLGWNLRRCRASANHIFIALGAALWILMYFGRPFWGPLLSVLGASEDMHAHRFIGAAQVFLVLIAAIALAEAWAELARRWHFTAAIVLTALLLVPMARERAQFLSNNSQWGRRNLAAQAAEGESLGAAIASARNRGGRVYAGLAATWGGRFKVGEVPVYASLSTRQLPTVGFLYHSMALTGDIMVRFNDLNLAQYRLFNIRTVIAPNDFRHPELVPREAFGRFQTLEAPGGGYFDLVDVFGAVKTDRRNFYELNDRWLQSDWPAKRTHLLLDWHGSAPPDLARMTPDAALPFLASTAPDPGSIRDTGQSGQVYNAEFETLRPAYAMFKMTWHPNWHAYVDGSRQNVQMLSPGFPGVALTPGRHRVEFRYEPGPVKPVLAILGVLLVAGIGLARLPLPDLSLAAGSVLRIPGLPQALGLLVLSAPICLPLFTSSLIWGHDAFCYFPRVVEVHQNVVNGILLPRWAPDLGSGYGQPLFLFHPPFFYWVAESWHLLGLDAVTAVNLACVVLVIAAAFAMFRLGRLYYGDAGGWLAASAYLYAPYFAVDLYVRSALEEFAAFPLVPLALYGFGAFARGGKRQHWLLGAFAYAALLFCHFPAALLFTPLLLCFVALTAWQAKSWSVLASQGAGLFLGLGIGAATWLPALAEKQYASIERVLQGNGQYSIHFVYPHQLFSTQWAYGYSLPGPNDGMSFSIGWSHALLALTAWIWIVRRPKLGDRALLSFFSAAAVILCVLMLDVAVWFWDHLPLLPYVELPWRLLGPVTLCGAMLAGALAPALKTLGRWHGLALGGALALLIVPNLPHYTPGRIAELDMKLWTPERLAATGFETTTMGEVTPRWMPAVPPYNPVSAFLMGDGKLNDSSGTPFSWAASVSANSRARLLIAKSYFPGWTARIDGNPVDVIPAPGIGFVEVAIPAGSHKVDIRWTRSPPRRLGESISGVCVLIVLGLSVLIGRPARTHTGEQ